MSILATSTSITSTREKSLEYILYIHYPVQFKDINGAQVQALINSESEVNAIHPTFTKQLGFLIQPTDVGVQKVDGTTVDNYGIVVAAFSMVNKAN